MPAEFVRAFLWTTLGQLLLVTTIFLTLAIVIFYRGLQRYESAVRIHAGVAQAIYNEAWS